MVSAKLTLVETDEELRRQKLAAMPKLEALANGFAPATDPVSPAPSKVAAGDTWTDMENCQYKGKGVHEAEFLREKAGRYVAAAYLCGDLIPSGVIRSRREGETVEMGLDPLSVIVRHSTVDSPSPGTSTRRRNPLSSGTPSPSPLAHQPSMPPTSTKTP